MAERFGATLCRDCQRWPSDSRDPTTIAAADALRRSARRTGTPMSDASVRHPPARPPQPGRVGRGRPHPPHHIPWRGWRQVIGRAGREVSSDRVSLSAAGCAFWATLSLFPADQHGDLAVRPGIRPGDGRAAIENIRHLLPAPALRDDRRAGACAGLASRLHARRLAAGQHRDSRSGAPPPAPSRCCRRSTSPMRSRSSAVSCASRRSGC